ncbi:MAG TPA: plasmid stabilization protein, partial [Ruminococcus sp.]|nr:plasmid stabilization protein [Ruminococcus sp.]
MNIKYSRDSLKFLAKMEKKIVQRIRENIQKLTLNPPQGDIKTMQGYSDGRLRLRVGKYRVIYRYDSENNVVYIYVIDIDSRG